VKDKDMKQHPLIVTLQQAKRLIRIVIGFTVLMIGIAMIALPGPAVVVIPIGLGILATEFVWAKHLLKRFKDGANNIKNTIFNNSIK
jgi:tellurite resistance protein TerC